VATARPTPPFSLSRWIEEHRHELKPPVANRQVFPAGDFVVMVVGGPNSRKDFHVDPGEEFFYQLEGRLTVRTMQDGRPVDHVLDGGDVFLLPAFVPHSPQRSAGSIGLVVERRRAPGERDAFQWYCERCHSLLYEESFQLENIETQFPPVFDRFYGDVAKRTCRQCGAVMERPGAAAEAPR
jgi:3-hydroxyanthranilate 3,4-dioxygenase